MSTLQRRSCCSRRLAVASQSATVLRNVAAAVSSGRAFLDQLLREHEKHIDPVKVAAGWDYQPAVVGRGDEVIALSFDTSNAAFVYKQNADGMMTEVPVEVGVSNGNYVEIKSGVTAGEEVFAQVETETASGMVTMLSRIFGGQQIMPGSGMNRRNSMEGDFSFPGGNGGGGGDFGGSSGGQGGGR